MVDCMAPGTAWQVERGCKMDREEQAEVHGPDRLAHLSSVAEYFVMACLDSRKLNNMDPGMQFLVVLA